MYSILVILTFQNTCFYSLKRTRVVGVRTKKGWQPLHRHVQCMPVVMTMYVAHREFYHQKSYFTSAKQPLNHFLHCKVIKSTFILNKHILTWRIWQIIWRDSNQEKYPIQDNSTYFSMTFCNVWVVSEDLSLYINPKNRLTHIHQRYGSICTWCCFKTALLHSIASFFSL